MGPRVAIGAALAKKDEKELTKHIKGCKPCACHPQHPKQRRAVRARKSLPQDFVLGKKASGQRGARNRQNGNGKCPEGIRHRAPQPSHLPHILLSPHGMDNAARTKKEASLKKGVGHEVKDGGAVGCYSGGEKHVAKLADGGVSENALDVILSERNRSGKE